MRLLCSAGFSFAIFLAAPALAQDRAAAGSDDDVHTGDPIIVTAPFVRSLDILGNVSVLEGDELARDIRGQIGDTLTRQAGVSATSFAPGASRPVLRGFSGERVRVLTDGIGSIDVSNTSADHAVTIDPLTVERIEILRGPAVLLFGSQAIGGAVNLFDRRIPRKVPSDHIHIDAIGGYATAASDRNIGSSIDVALSPQIVAHLDGSWRKTGDARSGGFVYAPDIRDDLLHLAEHEVEEGHLDEAAELTADANRRGKIPNTASETWTAAGGLSLINDGGQLGISVSYYDSKYGVPNRPGTEHHHESGEEGEEEEGHDHGEAPVTIGLKQWRADLRGEVELGDGFFDKLRIRAGFADYEHTEFEGDEVGTVFTNQGVEGRLELAQNDRGGLRGASGIQYSHRDFNAIGAEAFVPRNLTDQFALFTLQEWTLGSLGVEAAARYETTDVRAPALGIARSFDTFSGALGANYDISDSAKIGLSVARAVRAPSAEELFSNGPHIATQSFEIGDVNLKREASWGAEASFKVKTEAFSLSLTGYSNWFDNFIYSDATGEEEDELPVFQYFQRDARVWGFEAEASARLAQIGGFNIVGDVVADMTRAKIKGGDHVPRIPAMRVLGGLEAQGERIDARAEVEWTDDQTRIAPFETATKGFTLVNASISWRPLPDTKNLTLSLAANNIFDSEARRHASFTKDYVPLTGRDIRITARASF
ncbi:TonB-dependent receptor [Sphingopyxis bauzanensis]|uniref:TonB-dependent receptor n=1 Tax=Sphingopyxis bauzanensis TaxID=651663 RepID=A0A246K228_9SPHN|nr:TonB-dependent receptor [Sphingopyxis bauzanensis]OWQ99573.1 TonB-dependent receptor [Sphingopyxis bauzanensis]GGJ47135.1 TonB-dependent receptor [Sphingopyxis bauzanensis]